jgi:hypothetical protein
LVAHCYRKGQTPLGPAAQKQALPSPRIRLLAKTIYALGPGGLAYLFADLARGAPLAPTIEDYSSLEPLADVIKHYAVEVQPFAITGGRQ